MARIFKQTYSKPLPEGAVVFTRKGKRFARFKSRKGETVTGALSKDGEKVILEGKRWGIEFRDGDGILRRKAGYTDRRATEQEAARLEREAERQQSGLIDRHAEQRKRPLTEHVADWERSLRDKGNTEKHATEQAKRARVVFTGCRATFWPDMSASKVQSFIAGMRKDRDGKRGVGARTANSYLQAVKQFCRWMVADDRAATSPLAHLRAYNVKTDRRVRRRALTVDECRVLIETTAKAGLSYGMTGPERALLYWTALRTGFRVGELRSLTPDCFDLESTPPTITVEAAYSKHRRADVQAIPQALAADLGHFLANRDPEAPVFKPNSDKTADMLREDLKRAGIAPVDDAGNRVDFHALRHSFITHGAMSGLPVKVVQDLARHSDVSLTMNVYSHTVVADRAKAVEALPDLTGPAADRQAKKATGTDDAVPETVPFPTQDDKQNDKQTAESSQVITPRRTRTYDPLIKSQLLCQLS